MYLIRTLLLFFPVGLLPAIIPHNTACRKMNAETFFNAPSKPKLPVSKQAGTATNKYDEWNLKTYGLSKAAFEQAVKGFQYLQQKKMLQNTSLITIIDYSVSSSKKRLYVLDIQTGKMVFNTLVAHGRNSGLRFANSFSNEAASYKSSLGFYITRGSYTGANGYSMRLTGCEKGINDNAFDRAIVFHGAGYVSNEFINSYGYLGRSQGCPAVPVSLNKKIIDKIKNGTCMFLYAPAKSYATRSKILDS